MSSLLYFFASYNISYFQENCGIIKVSDPRSQFCRYRGKSQWWYAHSSESDAEKGGFDMTFTLCHRYTPLPTLTAACLNANLIVSAAGVPRMVKDGAAVVDVGLSRIKNDKGRNVVMGDVMKDVRRVAGEVTPMPGGEGPVMVACLMYNTFLEA